MSTQQLPTAAATPNAGTAAAAVSICDKSSSITADQRKRQFRWRKWESMLQYAVPNTLEIKRALDLGCGTGDIVKLFRQKLQWDAMGVDGDPTMLEAAPNLASHLVQHDITDLELRDLNTDEPFDLIWSSFAVQYFMEKLPQVLPVWMELLRPGGLIILVENHGLFSPHEPMPKATTEAFLQMEEALLRDHNYDCSAGPKLAFIIEKVPNLELLSDSFWDDAEFSFSGRASQEILKAWEGRIGRMEFPSRFFGQKDWLQHHRAFMDCISSDDHRTITKLRMVIARKKQISAAAAAACSSNTGTATAVSICDKVRHSCATYSAKEGCKYVTIHTDALESVARRIEEHREILWDEEQWHYTCPDTWPIAIVQERVALYILALDAINFCFWPSSGYEYADLAQTLTSLAQADHDIQQDDLSSVSTDYALSAQSLQVMTVETMRALLSRHHATNKAPPCLEQRCAQWNQVGRVLNKHYQGSAWNLIRAGGDSAVRLAELVVTQFPGFRDAHADLYFYKRAQILVGDWNAALQLDLRDMDKLTCFADYRLPQLLRHWDVLTYSDALAEAVDTQCELQPDSSEEWAIRAATVTVVEQLVEILNRRSTNDNTTPWTAVQVDWFLWQMGEKLQEQGMLRPHHRVQSIYY